MNFNILYKKPFLLIFTNLYANYKFIFFSKLQNNINMKTTTKKRF